MEDFPWRQCRKRFRSLVFSESLSINSITPFSLSLQAPNPRQPCIHSPWIGSTTEKARSRKIRTARITILRMTTTPRRRRRIGSWRALDPTPWRVSCSPSYSRRLWDRLKKKNKKKMVVAGERNTGMPGFREFWKWFLLAHSWLVLWSFRACLAINLKLTFSHFKQYYIYFYTPFHPHVFQKNTNNNFQTILPNTLLILVFVFGSWVIINASCLFCLIICFLIFFFF